MSAVDKWLTQIDNTTREFNHEFGNLSEEQLNWKPSPAVWSIAQNIDHLIVLNSTYYPVIEKVKAGTYELPWIGNLKFMVNMMGNMILKSVQPDRRKKMRTFPAWEPSKSRIKGDIIQRFSEHHNKLKEVISASEAMVTENVIISSPANRNIVYYFPVALDIITAHERRHLEQAKEIKTKLPKDI